MEYAWLFRAARGPYPIFPPNQRIESVVSGPSPVHQTNIAMWASLCFTEGQDGCFLEGLEKNNLLFFLFFFLKALWNTKKGQRREKKKRKKKVFFHSAK